MDPDHELKNDNPEHGPEEAIALSGSGYRYPVGRWDAVLIGPGVQVEGDGEVLDPRALRTVGSDFRSP